MTKIPSNSYTYIKDIHHDNNIENDFALLSGIVFELPSLINRPEIFLWYPI